MRVIGRYFGAVAPEPKDLVIAQALSDAAAAHGVPLDLLTAVAWIESRYNPRAVSPKGAVGLMQLMPATARGLGVLDRENPVSSALAGAQYLARQHARFGDWIRALGAYNWGPAHVTSKPDPEQWPEQVRTYVERVWEAAGAPRPFVPPPIFFPGGARP